MSSHNTKRHFRHRKGSHFCCHKLDWAALGWALGLHTESSSVPKGSIQGTDLVARPHPQLFFGAHQRRGPAAAGARLNIKCRRRKRTLQEQGLGLLGERAQPPQRARNRFP